VLEKLLQISYRCWGEAYNRIANHLFIEARQRLYKKMIRILVGELRAKQADKAERGLLPCLFKGSDRGESLAGVFVFCEMGGLIGLEKGHQRTKARA